MPRSTFWQATPSLEKERKFQCSLMNDPECLGYWFCCHDSARMKRHQELLSQIDLYSWYMTKNVQDHSPPNVNPPIYQRALTKCETCNEDSLLCDYCVRRGGDKGVFGYLTTSRSKDKGRIIGVGWPAPAHLSGGCKKDEIIHIVTHHSSP